MQARNTYVTITWQSRSTRKISYVLHQVSPGSTYQLRKIAHPEQKKRISYHVSNHMLALSTYVHDVDLNLNISLGVDAVLFGN